MKEIIRPKIYRVEYMPPMAVLTEKRKAELLREIDMGGAAAFDHGKIEAILNRRSTADVMYAEAYFLNAERIRRHVSSIR